MHRTDFLDLWHHIDQGDFCRAEGHDKSPYFLHRQLMISLWPHKPIQLGYDIHWSCEDRHSSSQQFDQVDPQVLPSESFVIKLHQDNQAFEGLISKCHAEQTVKVVRSDCDFLKAVFEELGLVFDDILPNGVAVTFGCRVERLVLDYSPILQSPKSG